MKRLEYQPPSGEWGDPDEEAALVKRAVDGDRQAAEKLYQQQARWIVKVSVGFAARKGWDPDEAVAIAHVFFFEKLLPRFDPSRGRLSTLVGVAIPRELYLRWRGDNVVRDKTACAGPNVSAQNRELGQRSKRVASLDRPLAGDEGRAQTFGALIEGPGVAIEAQADQRERLDVAQRALSQLDQRQQEILRRRLFDGVILEDVAAELGLTRERVRQIERQALRSLRLRYDAIVERGGKPINYGSD